MEEFQRNAKAALTRLSAIRIVPVLVLDNLDDGLRMCSILQEKQLSAAEITVRTEAAESVIRAAAKEFPEHVLFIDCHSYSTIIKANLQFVFGV